ncbi:hypothetical protein [Devosia sp. Leaf64]|uniref:hypothetical protein n=1 Tax=Devosia sp. Leaf64 TaxID=1736229 RepID=UPI000AE8A7A8|nr:hypothetical protein [Devosia sp. Leaf64]
MRELRGTSRGNDLHKGKLILTTMGLIGVAVIAAFVLDRLGVNASQEVVVGFGAVCGLLACGLAFRGKTASLARLAMVFVFAAVVLAGPVTAFFVAFGLASGFGGLSAFAGTWGSPGMDGVLGQSLVWVLIGTVGFFGFMSQAWALLRAFGVFADARRGA